MKTPLLPMLMCVAMLAGCASLGADDARIVPEGAQAFSAGVDLSLGTPKLSPGDEGSVPLPSALLTAAWRRGFGGDKDMGLRAWGLGVRGLFAIGAGADLRWLLTAPEAGQRGWSFLIKGGGGYHQFNYGRFPTHLPFLEAGTVLGYNTSGGDQLFLGLRFQDYLVLAQETNPVNLFFSGLIIGYDWRVKAGVSLQPQMGLLFAPVSFNGTIDDPERFGFGFLQMGFGVRWDR